MLYPTVSNYWNSIYQSRAIASYIEAVTDMDNNQYEAIWQAAKEYNYELAEEGNDWVLTEDELEDYYHQLDVSNNGIMGYIEVPIIDCSLPIYHGIDESVLQIAIGHVEGTSLPTGGSGTHTVLSGHRGLPSANLFTDLDQLVEGDIFFLPGISCDITGTRKIITSTCKQLFPQDDQDDHAFPQDHHQSPQVLLVFVRLFLTPHPFAWPVV